MIFKNSVRTSKKTQRVSMTAINWLMLFKEIIAVNFENYTKHKYILWEKGKLYIVKAGDKRSYHWALKG
jgi:hypothetical protein